MLWTEPAINDLKLIFNFYFSKNTKAARKIVNEIKDSPKNLLIKGFEEIGQKDDINPKYRRIIVRHYKVLYRIEREKIIIARIFDTRQNPEKLKEF